MTEFFINSDNQDDINSVINGVSLYWAVSNNDLVQTELMLSSGADINISGDQGKTPLHLAVASNRIESSYSMVEVLLSNGADVNARDYQGRTPLHLADSNRIESHHSIVEVLLTYGADVNARDYQSRTPLHVVADSYQIESLSTIEVLLTNGADVNARDYQGRTPLHAAAASNQNQNRPSAIKVLLINGANANVRDYQSWTPLHFAAASKWSSSYFQAMEVLLQNGADANAQDENRKTPMHYLLDENAAVDYIQLLLKFKADLNLEDGLGETPLVKVARQNARFEIWRVLVEYGSDVNSANRVGWTPLHYACDRAFDERTIKYLVKNGADVNVITSENTTPLMILMHNYPSITLLTFFLKYADVNIVDNQNRNALCFYDFMLNNDDIWKTLTKHLAIMRETNNEPIHSSLLETISSNEKFEKYFTRCREELEVAKCTKLKNCWVCFFDLLVDNDRKLKNYAGNADLIEDFENTNCLNKFPIYGASMAKKMNKAIERRKVFDESSFELSNNLPIFNPSHLIVRDILDCLTYKDYVGLTF